MAKFVYFLIFVLTKFSRKTDSLDCYIMGNANNVATGMSMMMGVGQRITCSPTVTQCYKYVCTGAPSNPYYILKGCLDYTSVTLSCTTMDATCRGQGGSGVCYTCNRNRCNGAANVVIGLATLILPFTYFFFKN